MISSSLPQSVAEGVNCKVMEATGSDSGMPSLASGTSYGETSSSLQTLQTKASTPKMNERDPDEAPESDFSSGLIPGGTDGPLVHDPSFEVEQVGNIRALDSGWLDEEVEEVMVVKKRRRPLSVIIESTECIHHSPPKHPQAKVQGTVDAADFEYIRTSCVSDTGEALIARKADTGQVYSVKLTRKSGYNAAALAARMRREEKMLRVLTECCVHFVLRLFWSFEDERAMYLVTDRNDGRNLRSVVQMEGPLPAREAVLCAAELVEGISGLHAHGITHTGLRPESVLLGQDGHVVISDFDEAGFLYDDVERHLVPPAKAPLTAQEFRAPELLLQWEYDYAVDWWSFGLVLFWTLTGTHPFVDERDTENNAIVRAKVLHAPLIEDRLGMDENAYRLIFRCLQRNPAMRIDGVGVKLHEYFQSVDWDEVTMKLTEAPFARTEQPVVEDIDPLSPELQDRVAPLEGQTQEEPFAFDWRVLSPSDVVSSPPTLSGIRGHLQALRLDHGPSDETLKPRDVTRSPTVVDEPAAGVDSMEDFDCMEDFDRTSGEFGMLPDGVSGPASRIGNLRRFSSLNFELESSTSGVSLKDLAAEDSTRALAPSPVRLRHARSILGMSLGRTADSSDAVSWTSRLRRRTRTGSPSLPPARAPAPPLPKGVQQIGEGIGYTRRTDVRRSVLTLASLTPRTCQSMFSGLPGRLGGKRRQKRSAAASGGEVRHEAHAAVSGDAGEEGEEEEEDAMEEVMREMYGSDWVAAGSSPAGMAGDVPGGAHVGLGWDEMLVRDGVRPVDASFAGADSTLRLVSPSTPRLGLY